MGKPNTHHIMACIKCKRDKEEVWLPHLPGKVCRACFLEIVEKRVRKNARIEGYFEEGGDLIFLDDGSANSAVSRYFLDRFTEHRPSKITVEKVAEMDDVWGTRRDRVVDLLLKKYPKAKLILPLNADNEAELFLGEMAGAGHKRPSPRLIKLIRCLSQKEVELFAKLKGFKYSKADSNDSDIKRLLERLSAASPDIKFAVLASLEAIDSTKRGGKNARRDQD
jgi:hypothetical protein